MEDEFPRIAEAKSERMPRLSDDRGNGSGHLKKSNQSMAINGTSKNSSRNNNSRNNNSRNNNSRNNSSNSNSNGSGNGSGNNNGGNSNNNQGKPQQNSHRRNKNANRHALNHNQHHNQASHQANHNQSTRPPKKRQSSDDFQPLQKSDKRRKLPGPQRSSADDHSLGMSSTSHAGVRMPKSVEIGKITYSDESPFEFINQVGQGTYGKVYKAIDRQNSKQLAMKRLRLELNHEGFPITAAREIKLLQMCKHPNIVHLCEIVVSKSEVYMALDYIQNDLAGLLLNKELQISPAQSKSIMRQVLCGLGFLHGKQVLHRDIKGSNVLVNGTGIVKLADFGLARVVNTDVPHVRYTNRVISLWYRPPELLLGSEHYGYEVDVWSVGCLFVEVFCRTPLFHGKDEVSQIQAIYSIMGLPKDNDWPEHEALPWNPLIDSLAASDSSPAYRLNKVFSGPHITDACFDLAARMLTMNPKKRISADDALHHPYFSEDPQEARLQFDDGNEWHDWEAKQRSRQIEDDDELLRTGRPKSRST